MEQTSAKRFLNFNKMKKILIFVAAMVMTAFVSCGRTTGSNETADSTAVVDSIEEVVDSVVEGDSVVADSLICND